MVLSKYELLACWQKSSWTSAEVAVRTFVVVFQCLQLALFSGVHEFMNKVLNFILVTNITARKKSVESCKCVELITGEIDIVCVKASNIVHEDVL